MAKVLWIDTETTGVNKSVASILEIAAVMEINGVEVDSFHSYVQPPPGRAIDEQALTICHISREDIESFTPEPIVAVRFLEWLNQFVDRYNKRDKIHIGGFNVEFDVGFLEELLVRNKEHFFGSYFYRDNIDLRAFAAWHLRDRRPDMVNGKLMSIAEEILTKQELTDALGGGVAHGAEVDIRVTIATFRKLQGLPL